MIKNLPAGRVLGFMSPRVMAPAAKLFRQIFRQQFEFLNFASDSRIAEFDTGESFGD